MKPVCENRERIMCENCSRHRCDCLDCPRVRFVLTLNGMRWLCDECIDALSK